MGTSSRTKQVKRASGAKKAAMRGKTRPYGFYGVIAVVVMAGIGGIALSRSGSAGAGNEHPGLGDHWHAAYGVDICGTLQPNLPQPATLLGLHTHNDGLVHVEPYVTGSILDRGGNANLARFAEGDMGFKLTSTEVKMPGGDAKKNGDLCDGKAGKLTIRVWPEADGDAFTDYTNPKDVKITDGSAITVAFVAEGAEIPKPTSIPNLANPNAGEG
jgi:hypothetical protein